MFKRKSVNVAALIALGVAAPVFAQQAQPQPKPDQLERVEVTGSRIKTVNTDTASPVISLGAEAIKVEAKRDVESLLNNLPQVFADQGGQVANGSSGTATVNLRNLGAARTLVLINGRRMPAGSPRNLATDLNQIPVSLIKRVEVLTGGASAIYGSDAISGVVNFAMNDQFEGVEIEANHQFFMHEQKNSTLQNLINSRAATNPSQFKVPGDIASDGKTTDFSVTMGSNFADRKGNATLFVSRKKTDALLQSERDFTACALNYSRTATAFGGFSCGGSGTSFPGQINTFNPSSNKYPNQGQYSVDPSRAGVPAGYGPLTIANAAGGVRPYQAATDAYNFGPLNYFQRPSARYTAAAFAHYDITDAAKIYAELNFHDDSTIAQIAPSGAFFTEATLSYENPLLSSAWRNAMHLANQGLRTPELDANGDPVIDPVDNQVVLLPAPTNFLAPGDTHKTFIARRNVEGGGRQDDIRHTSYRGVLGVKGDISSSFGYDIFTSVGKVVYQQTYKNDFSLVRIARSLDVVTDPDGKAVCRSALDGTDPNCVPWNIWSLNGVTPEALNYLQTPGFQKGFTSQNTTGFTVNGDLTDYGLKSPMANAGFGFAVGAERRTEKMDLSTDAAFTTGDLAGQGGPTIGVGGQYSVNDVFGEFRMPLMERKPFAELLNLTASYRKSSYSTKQKTDTFGLGLEYSPTREVKFRGSVQQASRAANIVELFAAQSLGLYDNAADPCAGSVAPGEDGALRANGGDGATAAQCARTGVTAAQFGAIADSPAGQYNEITGGNTSLKPEKARSTTFGVIFSPIKDTTISVDYFDIKVKDTISTVGSATILDQCLLTGDSALCSNVQRDTQGTLWLTGNAFIRNTNLNIGELRTRGVDLGGDTSFSLGGYGRLDLSLVGTYLDRYTVNDLPGLDSYDCAGLYGDICGNPSPVWRHKLRATWNTPWGLNIAATLRHIDKVKFENDSGQERLSGVTANQVARLGARDYLDLAASYKLNKVLTMRVAINNVLDTDPPIRTNGAGAVNGNTYPQVYESSGRQVSFNVTAKF